MSYEIGKRISLYRKQNKMSQKQLADKIGVSNSRVSNWEHGLNRPDVDLLAGICIALNVSPSELLDIHLDNNELTAHDKKLIQAYHDHADLQHAVNILLGLESNSSQTN